VARCLKVALRQSERAKGKPGFGQVERKALNGGGRTASEPPGGRERLSGRNLRLTGPDAGTVCRAINAGFLGNLRA